MNKNDKNKKLIIWEVCNEIDKRNISFYDNLSTDEKKSLPLYPLLRWISSVEGSSFIQEYYIQMANDVNKIFWDLSRYPELQWKLLANCGIGKKQKHKWISKTKGVSKTPLIDNILYELYPDANYEEIEIVKGKLTKERFDELCAMFGIQKSELKKYKDEFKKLS